MFSVSKLSKFFNVALSANQRCAQFYFRKVSHPRIAIAVQNVSANCYAYLHCSPVSKLLRFPDLENQGIHRAMENMPGYNDVVSPPTADILRNIENYLNSDLESLPSELCVEFVSTTLKNTKDQLTLEDPRFTGLVTSLVCHLQDATDDHLSNVLTCFCLWPWGNPALDPMFKLLWNKLDAECCRRLKRWLPSYKLYIADLWHHVHLSRLTRYNSLMIKDLIQAKETLSTPQLVQLMFYVNLQRDTPQFLLQSLEGKLERIINSINLEELCIVCLGFFKTKNRVVSKNIVKSVVVRLIFELPEANNNLALSGCIKFLRKSLHGSFKDLYVSLFHVAVKNVSKYNVPLLVHLALLNAEINIYMPQLLDSIMDRLIEEKHHMRVKDGMKFLHCLAQFNHQPKPEFNEFFQMILAEKDDYMRSYPNVLTYSLLSYAYLGYYPVNLITKALHPDFVQSCIQLNGVEMMNPISVLNYSVEIECENYQGPRVDQSILKSLQIEKGNIPGNKHRRSFQEKFTDQIYKILLDIYGSSDNICIKHILPHMYSPEIVLRLNPRNRQPLSAVLQEIPSNCIIKPSPDEPWACIMVCGACFFPYNSKRFGGLLTMRRRHLLKLGYKVLQVPYYEATNVQSLRKYIEKQLDLLKMNNLDIPVKRQIL